MKRNLCSFMVLGIAAVSLAVFELPVQAKPNKTIPVEVIVDFGPAGKPGVQKQVEVSKGSTPKDAVSTILPILTGVACCDTREIISIDGVSVNPAENQWWICQLNGSKKVSPQKTQLKAGDVVQWAYITDVQ